MFKKHSKLFQHVIFLSSTGHPEIFPLVLTTRTQEIFNCRVDEDVTEENCFKLIKKDDIIQDLKTRAAISDFHPVKNIVLVCSLFCSHFKTLYSQSVHSFNGKVCPFFCLCKYTNAVIANGHRPQSTPEVSHGSLCNSLKNYL